MNKCYDSENNRLIFMGNKADSQYWDTLWSANDFPKCTKKKHNPFIVNNTRKYLAKGSKILEGGCGKADKVYALKHAGYDAYGIDFAKDTVERINRAVPELKVRFGDIRAIEFPDGYFDGYWSIGVIEHFFEGYEDIAGEMHRVLRKGGYLFMTVPAMSILRKAKAFFKLYHEFDNPDDIQDRFYQFALSPEGVVEQFSSIGFELVKIRGRDGVKGLRDEIGMLRRPLQWCWEGKSVYAKAMKAAIQATSSPFAGHMAFFIFKKV